MYDFDTSRETWEPIGRDTPSCYDSTRTDTGKIDNLTSPRLEVGAWIENCRVTHGQTEPTGDFLYRSAYTQRRTRQQLDLDSTDRGIRAIISEGNNRLVWQLKGSKPWQASRVLGAFPCSQTQTTGTQARGPGRQHQATVERGPPLLRALPLPAIFGPSPRRPGSTAPRSASHLPGRAGNRKSKESASARVVLLRRIRGLAIQPPRRSNVRPPSSRRRRDVTRPSRKRRPWCGATATGLALRQGTKMVVKARRLQEVNLKR